ncbi:hypothetical protein M405DRAFT_859829 [Rhizopogon salebrosus TDB-379]|nr:hypothetical protein M405DRAFT_859829 [Rhizopogon salebrosus TDB-379]
MVWRAETSPPPQTGPSRHANSLQLPHAETTPHPQPGPSRHTNALQPHSNPVNRENPAKTPRSPESTLSELTPPPSAARE